MLPIKKIYVDSRFKTSPSESHTNFTIELPLTMLMPEDTGFYIEDVCIPHTWPPSTPQIIICNSNTLAVLLYTS